MRKSGVSEEVSATPVVVLRSGHHGGLGIVRSLGRLGVPVYCVDGARWEPAFSSRYCRGRWILNCEGGPAKESIARLLEIAEKVGGRPVLVPTTDDGAIWVADHAAALQEGFRFPLPGCLAGPPVVRQEPHAGARPPERRADCTDDRPAVETGRGAVPGDGHLSGCGQGYRLPTACAAARAAPNSSCTRRWNFWRCMPKRKTRSRPT